MYKVLLVDDEYMILQGLTMIIDWQALGFEVVQTARSGKEALAYLTQYPVDVMISDVTMPGMTGLDLIEAAKTYHPQLQTLILSGYQEFSYVQKAMELETKGYLLKPVDKAELQAKMKQFKDWLDAQQAESIRQEAYHDSLLTLWLTDELSEKEFQQLSQGLPAAALTGFTVLYLDCQEWQAAIDAYFEREGQPFYLKKKKIRRFIWLSYLVKLIKPRRLPMIYKSDSQETCINLFWEKQLMTGKMFMKATIRCLRASFTIVKCHQLEQKISPKLNYQSPVCSSLLLTRR